MQKKCTSTAAHPQATLGPDGSCVERSSCLQLVEAAPSDHLTSAAGATNLGLLTLGNVVSALGDPRRKVNHVPYQVAGRYRDF